MATARALLSSALLATLASAQLPPWPPSWRMNDSTIAMPCNFSGYTDPAAMAGWAITDYDVRRTRVARATRHSSPRLSAVLRPSALISRLCDEVNPPCRF